MAIINRLWNPAATTTDGLLSDGSSTGTGGVNAYDSSGEWWKLGNGATPSAVTRYLSSVMVDAGSRVSFRFKTDLLPSATTGTSVVQAKTSSGGSIGWNLALDSAGKLRILNGAGTTLIGPSSIVLAINTEYRISFAYTMIGTALTINVYVDGSLALAGTAVTASTTGLGTLLFTVTTGTPASRSYWFKDVYVDDGTDRADPNGGHANGIRLTYKRPIANGSLGNTMSTPVGTTSGVGTGRSGYVNYRPPTASNRLTHTNAATLAIDTFQVEGAAAGAVDLSAKTLIGRSAWWWTAGVATDVLIDDGTETIPGLVSGVAVYHRPTTASAYPTNADAVGWKRPTVSATTGILSGAGMVFAYTDADPTVISGVGDLLLLGVG